jgi:hypothetical protein
VGPCLYFLSLSLLIVIAVAVALKLLLLEPDERKKNDWAIAGALLLLSFAVGLVVLLVRVVDAFRHL